jgi:hypothetical protein
MVSRGIWDEETADVHDEDAAKMFAPELVEPAVACLARLAGSGPVLEFAIGSGRIGIPLVQRGIPVPGRAAALSMELGGNRATPHPSETGNGGRMSRPASR